MNSTVSGILLIVFGLLAMIGSALKWRFINRSRKLINILFGETVARIVYFVVGVLVFILGVNWLRL